MSIRHLSVALVALFAIACSGPTAKTKNLLTKHGTIDAEWEVRDEAKKSTHTYVLLRTKSGTHELYELVVVDSERKVARELIGGIDGTGCYLMPSANTTPWVLSLGPEAMEDARPSGDKTRTKCLEYKEMKAWSFIPEADRKAAEPPPPPPKPAVSPDAGTADGGAEEPAKAEDPGAVKDPLGL